jgi:WD40 repeat protein
LHIKTLGLNEDITRDIKFDLVCRGFHSGSIDSVDIAVQRPIIVTASREDSTIRIWNYFTHQCELAREYYILEDASIRDAVRPLKSIAIHPSGYYLAASFIDKIRLYHILHDELRAYKTIEVKNCQRMRFNPGGNFFFVVDGKNVIIYNAYTLQRLHQIKATPEGVSDIVFGGDRDSSSFAIVTPDGFLGRYRLPNFAVIKEREANSNVTGNNAVNESSMSGGAASQGAP